jgi:hypothetical protein
MSGYATAKNILREGYFWPSIFKDCIRAVQKCHACQIYNHKSHAPCSSLLSPNIGSLPLNWGILD